MTFSRAELVSDACKRKLSLLLPPLTVYGPQSLKDFWTPEERGQCHSQQLPPSLLPCKTAVGREISIGEREERNTHVPTEHGAVSETDGRTDGRTDCSRLYSTQRQCQNAAACACLQARRACWEYGWMLLLPSSFLFDHLSPVRSSPTQGPPASPQRRGSRGVTDGRTVNLGATSATCISLRLLFLLLRRRRRRRPPDETSIK